MAMQWKVGNRKPPRFVYRYLADEKHAQDMMRGLVWISTFGHIRTTDANRGDPREGRVEYRVNAFDPDTPSEDAKVMRQRMEQFGLFSGIATDLRVYNFRVQPRDFDAYILCTSLLGGNKHLRGSFGNYCVRIAEPQTFLKAVAEALRRDVPIAEAALAPVNYAGREFADAEPSVGHPWMANVAGNEIEREVRFVWAPRGAPDIAPRYVEVQEVANLLSMV